MDQQASLQDPAAGAALRPPVWGPWATAGFGLAIGGALLAVGALLGLILLVVWLAVDPSFALDTLTQRLEDTQGLIAASSTVVGAVITMTLVVIFIKARHGLPVPEYLGLKRISWKTVLVLLAVTLTLLVVSSGLDSLLDRPANEFDIRIYETSLWPPLLFAALVVFAPLSEESLFRGFLFQGFHRSRLGGMGTVILMAIVWSALHIQYDLYGIGTIFVLGLIIGWVRLRTGSLWSSLLMHGLWNLAATVLLALQQA